MAIRQLKPVTPASRFTSRPDFSEITTDKPEKSLVRKLKKTGGRNNKGRITSRRRGGGVIFGPSPKFYFKKVNTKTKQLAFKCILSDKVKNDSFKVVESLPSGPKTKEFISFLKKNNLEGKKITIISSVIDDNLSLASRNVPYVSLVKASSCSVRDLFDNDLILIDVSGLEDLSKRFGGKN